MPLQRMPTDCHSSGMQRPFFGKIFAGVCLALFPRQREGLRSRGRDGLGDIRHADPGWLRPATSPLYEVAAVQGPTRSSHFKTASSQIRGLYLVKFAVSVTACVPAWQHHAASYWWFQALVFSGAAF